MDDDEFVVATAGEMVGGGGIQGRGEGGGWKVDAVTPKGLDVNKDCS